MKRFAAALAAVLMLTACTQVEENIPVMAETSAVTEDTDASVDVTTAVSSEIVSEEITSETEPETSETISESEKPADETTVLETTAAEEVQTEAPAAAENSAEETSAAETTTTEAVYEDAQAESTGTVTGIELTFYDVTLSQGEHKMPIVTMSPESAPDKSEIWTSSDESVAKVDGLGNITAVGEGTCVVTVASAASPNVTAKVNVTVKAAPGLTYIGGILIANKTYALPADYNPGVDPEAQAAFDDMQAAAAKEGLNIYVSSGFRSYEYQSGLYDRYVQRSGKAEADRYSARPGHSEHQTGLAFDMNTIDISFADTDEYVWVKAHCWEYGFIIRYPEDGEDVTGYMYEPWHIRYLGKETAKKVYDSGLTLEEYLGIDSKYSE